MQFEPTEEQAELRAIVREILTRRADGPAVRRAIAGPAGYDPELWRMLCEEVGAAALAIPEEYGGAGFSRFETHLVLEELGYSLVPSPYLGSVALAAQAILASGDEDACRRLLPAIADGSALAALGWADPRGRFSPATVAATATFDGEWHISGEIPLVLEGHDAAIAIVIAGTDDGPRMFELTRPEALERTSTPALDPTLRFATWRMDAVPARPLGDGDPNALDTVRDRALAAIASTQSGTAARGLDMTVAYAAQRVQFGRPIGSFQALKHRMADMHVKVETSRTASRAAAWADSEDAPERAELALLAKASCSDALSHVGSETIQLHGGIGITWEHDAQLVFKRAHATAQLFGTAAQQRTRAAVSLGLVVT
ncbi:acyl-CoA dehydrogenase family protein [Microbacterium luticocti]|uniref:acyl-CoA dehydrogenase family protein n=1 Tax=Microbacterium luticocti TaxID=451764 RepID=UPI0004298678|nr:acyl-CoA dehydrogenase family protein [Microbacterium luticocti]